MQGKGFDEALIDASELAKNLDAEPLFKIQSKCLCKKKENYLIMNLWMNLCQIQKQPSEGNALIKW